MLEFHNLDCDISSQHSPSSALARLWVRGIAHDFCNLIQTTRGTLELLQYDCRSAQDLGRLKTAIHGLDTMSQLAQRLQEHFPMVPIAWTSLKPLIMEAVSMGIQSRAVTTIYRETANLPTVYGDPNDLGRIFLNLTWNACDAMGSHGEIVVCASATPPPHDDRLATCQGQAFAAAGWLCIDFCDTGLGMTPEQLDHLFSPYYTTKLGGQGLGLATVSSLIHRQGGLITVDSEVGKGTTFHLFFPAGRTADGPHGPNHTV